MGGMCSRTATVDNAPSGRLSQPSCIADQKTHGVGLKKDTGFTATPMTGENTEKHARESFSFPETSTNVYGTNQNNVEDWIPRLSRALSNKSSSMKSRPAAKPECSALMDSLEQSACHPELANDILKSLHRILQLANEQTVASFKSLDVVSRVLKVACVQAQEFRRCQNNNFAVENGFVEDNLPQNCQGSGLSEMDQNWLKCMETSLNLFNKYWSLADDAKICHRRLLKIKRPSCICVPNI